MPRRTWQVEFHPACEQWARGLPQADQEALLAAIRVLRSEGPTLGRPLVDTISGSSQANMKELRPGSTGRTEIRVLFAFDLERNAVLLVGGDKSQDWGGWYHTNVPVAEERLEQHQQRLRRKQAPRAKDSSRRAKGKGSR